MSKNYITLINKEKCRKLLINSNIADDLGSSEQIIDSFLLCVFSNKNEITLQDFITDYFVNWIG